jgi:hypothetical protein
MRMFCVLQTEDYVHSVKRLGLTDAEAHAIVQRISEDPQIGELIPGTGGARKWRIPFGGKGKRGGGRVVSYYAGEDVPVFLLDIFSKGEKINLSQAERNELKDILQELAEDYRIGVRQKVSRLQETGT